MRALAQTLHVASKASADSEHRTINGAQLLFDPEDGSRSRAQ